MKAARINQWGQPIQIEDIPQPTVSEGEVLVRVHAASINPIDVAILAGYLAQMLTTPMTGGTDFAGEVVSIGDGVTSVQPGDAVFGFVPLRGGPFAEYVCVKASEVALKPASLSYVQAAAVPLVSMTAWRSLFDVAKLQSGERLLVQGAGGSVGGLAVQYAKEHNVHVIGVAGPQKAAYMQELGVDQAINYQDQPFEDVASEVDVVFDTVGGNVISRSFKVLKPGGRLVTVVGQPSQEEAASYGVEAVGAFAIANPAQLANIARLIDTGKVKVTVQKVFPFEEIQAALELFMTSKSVGKVVLEMVKS